MTYVLRLRLPRQVGGRSREDFFEWAWSNLARHGLAGIHEGTLLSDQAWKLGLETESWTIDSGEAPRDRDWVSSVEEEQAELYFESREGAEAALRAVASAFAGLKPGSVAEQPAQDWDAEWKASFRGVDLPPHWRVVPPWVEASSEAGGLRLLRLNPGAGFGTGTHETTQLCLQAIGELGPARLKGARVLDFGSGSGILAVACALLGARVDAVEIDDLAIQNSRENAALNGVADALAHHSSLPEPAAYGLVVANILKPVLLQFAPELCARAAPGAPVVLSGLMQPDVEAVVARYSALLLGREAAVRELGEWRAVVLATGGS